MATFCVNINSKQFKDTAKRLDISEGQLELIAHEYGNIEGQIGEFPSDEYILSKVNGRSEENALPSTIDLWNKRYQEPQTFDTFEEFEKAKHAAMNFFPEYSIGVKKTAEGKYEMRVAEPLPNRSEYQKELAAIKEKAIANGTFMLAPNGNPTNLNEQQWLQVRTKAFKEWFGDWEKVARSSKYRKSMDIPNSLTSATFQGVSVSDVKFDPDMAPDGGTRIVFLGDKYIGEIPVFEIEDSIHMGGSIGAATHLEAEYRGKGYGKKAHIALANIAKAEGKTLYSDDSNSDAEDELWKSLVRDGIAEIVDEKPKRGDWNHTTYRIINNNLPNAESITFGDEDVSKVVDKNGEPLVVYTGVPIKGITEFSLNTPNRASLTSTLKKGIYFSDRDTANLYTKGKPSYKTTKEVNASQAKKIDDWYWGEGAFDNDAAEYVGLPLEVINKYIDDNTNEITGELDIVSIPKGEVIAAFLNIKNPVYADANGEVISHLSEKDKAAINNSEGAIIEHVDEHTRDDLRFTDSTDYIVFNPNQIKSATENIGTFSRESDDIRFNKTIGNRFWNLYNKLNEQRGPNGRVKRSAVAEYNKLYGTNFGWNPKTGEVVVKSGKIKGVSILNNNDTEIIAKKRIDRAQLLQYLGDKFNLQFKEVEPLVYDTKVGKESNCCVIGKTVFIRKGDLSRLTNEQLIEEFLHPAIHAMYSARVEGIDGLLAEAKRLFPDLTKQIGLLYETQGRQVQEEELITQVLSKYLNREISDKGTNTRRLIDYIEQFIENIISALRDLFGNVSIQKGDRITISGKDIKEVFSFQNLAELINSKEVSFNDVLPTGEKRNNLEVPSGYEFRVGYDERVILHSNTFRPDRYNGPREKEYSLKDGEIYSQKWHKDARHGWHYEWKKATNPPADVKKFFEEYSINKTEPQSDTQISQQQKEGTESNAGTLEVSTDGDEFGKQFSAFNAKFKQGTVIDGVDVSGRSVEDVYQNVIKKSGKNRPPATFSRLQTLYRGYATKTETRVKDLDETVGNTAADYIEGIPNFTPKYHFTSSREEAEGYAASRTDKSEEVFYKDGKLIKQQNRHYTGDFAQVGSYYISKDAKIAIFEDLHDLNRNSQRADGVDIIVLKKGTLDQSASEFIVKEGSKHLIKELPEVSKDTQEEYSYQEGYLPLWKEWARQNPELMEQLRQRAEGKTLTDKFAYGAVSQARALTEILESQQSQQEEQRPDVYSEVRLDDVTINPDYPGQAGTNQRTGEIQLKKASFTPEEVIRHLQGESGQPYTEQKKAVLERLAAEGWTLDRIKDLVKTSKDATTLVLEHELSHRDNKDSYNSKTEAMSEKALEIETRATRVALENLERYKASEALKNTVENKISEDNEAFDRRQRALVTGIDALKHNDLGLTDSDIFLEAQKLANWISDNITEWLDNPESAYKVFDNLAKTNDWATEEDKQKDLSKLKGMSRKDFVSMVGIKNILNVYSATIFNGDNAINLSFEEGDKVFLLDQNINTLFELGIATFNATEGFSIIHNEKTDTYETVESEDNEVGVPEVDPIEDGAEISEEQRSLEDWQVDKATVEVLGNASALVKAALSKCYELDANGNQTFDYLGRRNRISMQNAVKSIVKWTQGALDMQSMIKKLQEKSADNPWLKQIIDRLTFEGKTKEEIGKDTDFRSQFYTVFQKHFQLSDIIKKGRGKDGKFYSMDVNRAPAVREIYGDITAALTLGTSPMFTSMGISKRAYETFSQIVDKLSSRKDVDEDYFNTYKQGYATRFADIIELFGSDVPADIIAKALTFQNFKEAIKQLESIKFNLSKELGNDSYNPYAFTRGKNAHGIGGYLKDFLKVVLDAMDDTMDTSYYENGKLRQAYLIPSYSTKLFLKLRGDNIEETLDSEYGWTEWFKDENGWRLPWLQALSEMPDETRKKLLNHKVNLNFTRSQYMRGMSPEKYVLSILTEFAGGEDVNGMSTAYYRYPIQSNKTSSDFVSFYRYNGASWRDSIIDGMMAIFNQELSRIQTVKLRNKKEGDIDYIENYDTNGKKFCLLDFLGDTKRLVEIGLSKEEAEAFQKYVEDKTNGEDIGSLGENELVDLAKKAIKGELSKRSEEFYTRCGDMGLIDSIKKIEGVKEKNLKEFIENFIWNDSFAVINITELLVTDLAYYKDSDDFQKRFAQVHSPGIRGDKNAVDYNGNAVSDGYIRTVCLGDFDTYKSNILQNLSIILDRNIDAAPEGSTERKVAEELKDSILRQMSKINVNDGQAFMTPTAMRKKGFIFGTWSREFEAIYEKIRNNNYTLDDLRLAFNVKKPFIYSQLTQDAGVTGAPMSKIKVPTQIKDSEYLLLMANALMEGQNTGIPNLLKILYEVGEESAEATEIGSIPGTKGIDIFAFTSAFKSGITGVSDVAKVWGEQGKVEDVAAAEKALKDRLLYGEKGKNNGIYGADGAYNDFVVKQIPVEDYAIQNEVPLHTLDHTQIHGSQERAIVESNLAYVDSEGNAVEFTWEDEQGNKKTGNRDAFTKDYENTVKGVIDEAAESVRKEFKLDDHLSKRDRNLALAKVLQKEILSNPERYGIDMLLACTVNEDGEFRLPIGDPAQSKRMEQLINSVIKNRINKPKVAGGLAVQVSSIGTSRKLNFRFFDKTTGKLLPVLDEWLAQNEGKTEKDYLEYCRERQGGFAYEENYSPAHTRDFFTMFTDKNGNVDIEAIEMLDPMLLMSIDQRTPTEYYYSITVSKTVGILPRWAGDGKMRPYEIVEKDDSDFDVDKETQWKLECSINKRKDRMTFEQMLDAVPELKSMELPQERLDAVIKEANEFVDSLNRTPEEKEAVRQSQIDRAVNRAKKKYGKELFYDFIGNRFSSTEGKPEIYKKMKEAYVKFTFSVEYPTEGAAAKKNKLWKMTLASMQSESNASKVLSPGGFAQLADLGYFIEALRKGEFSASELDSMDASDIKKLAKAKNTNLMSFSNQVDYYQRNNDASSNLGIFAVANTAHALLEGQGYAIANPEEFTIAGKTFGDYVIIDDTFDDEGIVISKSIGMNVGASADAAKTPSHAYMNINKSTINEFLVLLRTGMPINRACLFMSTAAISNLLSVANKENVESYKEFSDILNERIEQVRKKLAEEGAGDVDYTSKAYDEELTLDEIMESINPKTMTSKSEYKILLAFQRLGTLTDGMRALTFATRYNSVSSAVGPQLIDNLIHEGNVNRYNDRDNSNLMQREIALTDIATGNTISFGDKVKNLEGKEVVVTPQNYNALAAEGVISAKETYNKIILNDVLRQHPMLESFAQGYGIAGEIFGEQNMPLYSAVFKKALEHKDIGQIASNRELLNDFADFFLSYCLVANNVISKADNPTDGLEYYIKKFPVEFLNKKVQHKGNPLVDAILKDTVRGIPVLKINTTGLKAEERQKLKAGWADLFRKDRELAVKLFKYNFWRGGVGFSPKTFMSLLPIEMREELAGYADTYSRIPSVPYDTLVDQFYRHNSGNKRLVTEVETLSAKNEDGTYTMADVGPYIKASFGGKDHLFKRLNPASKDSPLVSYKEVSALGNNKQYLEISTENIESAMIENTSFEDDSDSTAIPKASEPENYVAPKGKDEAQIQREVDQFLDYLKGDNGEIYFDESLIRKKTTEIKRGERPVNLAQERKGLKQFYDRVGITYTESKINEAIEIMC